MIDELFTDYDAESVDGAAADETTELRPDEGEAWLVYDIYCYHDDNGGARDCAMKWYDGTSLFTFADFAALANATRKWLRKDTGNNLPLLLTRQAYFQWQVQGIAAGKKGYIRALVKKIHGVAGDAGG